MSLGSSEPHNNLLYVSYKLNVLFPLQLLLRLLGVHEFLPSSELMDYLTSRLCHGSVSRYMCENFIFLIAGFDGSQFNVVGILNVLFRQ